MAQKSKIEWTEKTWNPVTGCTKVSQGCKNCYAETFANRKMGEWGKPFAEHRPDGVIINRCRKFTDVVCHTDRLNQPLKWRKPAKVFVNSMSDLFHEDVPFEFINKVFAVMVNADKHIFQILTKRPERALKYFNWAMDQKRGTTLEIWKKLMEHYYHRDIRNLSPGSICEIEAAGTQIPTSTKEFRLKKYNLPFKNVWIGVSVEDQKTADERIPLLLQIPAAIRFLSCEPLLGEIDINRFIGARTFKCKCGYHDTESELTYLGKDKYYCKNCEERCDIHPAIYWVICGGESGHGARPMHPDWARKLRDDCQAAGVPYFFKQWGEWSPVHNGDVTYISKTKSKMNIRLNGETEPYKGGYQFYNGYETCIKLGKKAAGRLLDGVEHNGMPGRVK